MFPKNAGLVREILINNAAQPMTIDLTRFHLPSPRLSGRVLLLACVLSVSLHAQRVFEMHNGGAAPEEVKCVIQTSTKHYMAVGYTKSMGAGAEDIYIVKTDSVGNLVWAKSYGGSSTDIAYSISPNPDGTFEVVGKTFSYGSNGDMFIMKIDGNGIVQASSIYGGSQLDYAYCIRPTSDGGQIIAGSTKNGNTNMDLALIKLDPFGGIAWQRTYGKFQDEEGYSVDESYNGYIVVGSSQSFSNGNKDAYVLKVGPFGFKQWSRRFGPLLGDAVATDVRHTPDSGYVVTGYGRFAGSTQDMFMAKLDSNGVLLWGNIIGTSQFDDQGTAVELSNGKYYFAGNSMSFPSDPENALLIETDDWGSINWIRSYGKNTLEDQFFSLSKCADGGFALGGSKLLSGSNYDMYLVKTNNAGQDGCTDTLVSLATTAAFPQVFSPPDSSWLPSLTVSVVNTLTVTGTGPANTIICTNCLPPGDPVVSGPDTICYTSLGASGYFSACSQGASTYNWALYPATGGTFVGQGTDNIYVIFDSTQTSVTVVCWTTNACGSSNYVNYVVHLLSDSACKGTPPAAFYNGITPNGDGYNDIWILNGVDSINDVHIFNRWGQLVWSTKNYNNRDRAWGGQGKDNKLLPSGTYYYFIETYGQNYKGWVELTR